MPTPTMRVDGEVDTPRTFTFDDLAAIDPRYQVSDVTKLGSKRAGDAVALAGLLELVNIRQTANYIGLHGTLDNFHASLPLAAIRDRALVIYRRDGQPLDTKAGGPFRFFIPDHAACHIDEIDECANVKFLDHIELTVERGVDNRPEDDDAHAKLHGH